jgi:predicted O-methyltransferase YrrM
MNTLEFLKKRYDLKGDEKYPIILKSGRQTELVKLFRKLGFKTGVEIGTSGGFYAGRIMKTVPNLKLYCVDPYITYSDYVETPRPEDQTRQEEHLRIAKERLKDFNVTFVRKTSRDAANDFEDNSIDFVYIDGNHSFEYVIEDIALWTKKVRKGGIIAGHDYWTSSEKRGKIDYKATPEQIMKLCQVEDAVNGWTKANQIKPWFILIDDKCPSWYWVKQ